MTAPDANFNAKLANAQTIHQSGDFEKAVYWYEKLTIDFPEKSEPFHLWALAKSQQGQYETAIPFYQKAISIHPENVLYQNNLAEALQRTGREVEAIQLLQQALAKEPTFYLGKHKLASILKKMKDFAAAEQLFLEVIDQKPDYDPAHFQLGSLYLHIGKFKSANRHLLKANELSPKAVLTLNNLAVSYQELGKTEEAKSCYLKVLELDSSYVESLRNMALLSEKTGEVQKAKDHFSKLAQVKNDPLILWNAKTTIPQVFSSKVEINAYREMLIRELNHIKTLKVRIDVEQLTQLDIYPPTGIIYQGLDDLPIKLAYADLFKTIPQIKLPPKKSAKPKVGFVVTGGHEGVFIKCMMGLINRLSTDLMDIFIICSYPNGQKIIVPHVTNPAIRFIVMPKSLGNSVKLLASFQFDLLHYWEVGTDAFNYFLPFFKPARIQVTSWGWPVTSGNPQIDLFISCHGLDDENSQSQYSEKLMLFDRLPVFYTTPNLPEFSKSKIGFGLHPYRPLYVCVQNAKKLHPDFDDLLKGILEKDKAAQIVLVGSEYPAINQALKVRLERVLGQHMQRLVVLPRLGNDDYFEMLNLADVVLDTVHYTGGANTNYDAFALGKPVVTLSTNYHRGRYTETAYRQMDMDELIAKSTDDYVDLATKLVNDEKYKLAISEKILLHAKQLFEDQQAVLELETFMLSKIAELK